MNSIIFPILKNMIGSIMRKCYLYSYKDIKESKKGLSKKSVQKVKKKGNRADEYFVTVQSTPNNAPTALPRKAATMASKEETP